MTASCFGCPNFVDASDTDLQKELYGVETDVDSCLARGQLLSTKFMTYQDREEHHEKIAETCSSFGKPTPPGQRRVSMRLGIGQPPNAATSQPVKSCRSCHFWLHSIQMSERIDIPLGLCTKFGNLIPNGKTTETAAACGKGARTVTEDADEHYRELWESFHIDPMLKEFMETSATAGKLQGHIDRTIDPTQYPSDRDVTAQQSAIGIRAWRRITSEGKEVFLPIFDIDHFTPEEQAKIPRTGDDEHPENYEDHIGLTYIVAALWMELDETPALHGGAGTGKTEFFRYMAWLMCLPFERISITRSTEIEDLAGKMHLENEETVFKYGRIPKAWMKKNIVLIDEPNVGTPDVWQYIRPLTDNSKQLVNDLNEGEVIKRDPFTFMGMALNPAWDARNVGAEVIGDADGSRLMHIFVDLPSEEIEREIITKRCELDKYEIPERTMNIIMGTAQQLRTLSEDGSLPVTWGIRNNIKVARATKWFGLRRAYQLAVADYLEPSVRDTILDIADQNAKSGGAR